ncbi:MAG: glycosyltransferase family 4 protein, partial [candidate division Zixibacteria bacterium]|nr:glycosyltransferase family 4 protein [candidate division Zixibacteria bacterium]
MEDRIRLLMLTHNYPRFTGDYAGVFLALLARRLLKHNIQPIVLAPHDKGAAEYEENSGVKIYRFRYASDENHENLAYRGNMQQLAFGSAGGLLRFRNFLKRFSNVSREIIEKENIDILAGHWLLPTGLVMKSLARKTSLPMLLSSHGSDIRLMGAAGKLPYRYLRGFCRRLSRWTVVSSFLKEQVLQLDSQLMNMLEVLPLPHDETIFYKDKKIEREEALVVSITRFTKQKRVRYLIEAFSRVVQERPSARLHIYGSGPLRSEIERLITAHGLTRHVQLIAPVSQEKLREIYNRASLVVLNSWREGFGLTLSEAMLCGAPVVGVKSGGITDIIKHEERGLLVEPDDNRELAAAIIRLLKDQPLREKLADAGHRFASENYS